MLEGGDPTITDSKPGTLHISWPLKSFEGTLVMDIDERQMKMKVVGAKSMEWFLDMTTADMAKLPFKKISANRIDCQFDVMKYAITAKQGFFSEPGEGIVFRITPKENTLILNLSQTDQAK